MNDSETFGPNHAAAFQAPDAKDASFQAPALVRAGFWERFLASFLDGIILSSLTTPLQVVFGWVAAALQFGGDENGVFVIATESFSVLMQLVASLVYSGILLSRHGATWGKMIIGLKVIDPRTGRYPSFWQGSCRDTVGKALSCVILLVGFLMAAWRGDKRALHDLMFHTIVVKVRK